MITRDLQFVQWLLSCLVCGVVKAAAISGMSFANGGSNQIMA